MSQRNVTTRSTTPRPGVVGRGGHEDQDVDVGVRMQLAAAVAADRRERPAFVAGGQLRAPHFAQDGVDELGARVHQHFHRLVGAEALGELGVRFLAVPCGTRRARNSAAASRSGRCARRSQGALRRTVVSVASMSSSSEAI